MSRKVVFLLEEPSMKVFLDQFVPRVFPSLQFLCIPHEGKSDLERSVPRKLRSWTDKRVIFVVLRDNDGANCKLLKKSLVDLCIQAGRPDSLVRIVCQELESWYLGEVKSLADNYRITRKVGQQKNPYRDPDSIGSPSNLVKILAPDFQKIEGARIFGQVLSHHRNASMSLKSFVNGLSRITGEVPQACY